MKQNLVSHIFKDDYEVEAAVIWCLNWGTDYVEKQCDGKYN